MLANKGYTLQRADPDMKLDEKYRVEQVKHNEQSADQGFINKYSDITKRALEMVAKWFVA